MPRINRAGRIFIGTVSLVAVICGLAWSYVTSTYGYDFCDSSESVGQYAVQIRRTAFEVLGKLSLTSELRAFLWLPRRPKSLSNFSCSDYPIQELICERSDQRFTGPEPHHPWVVGLVLDGKGSTPPSEVTVSGMVDGVQRKWVLRSRPQILGSSRWDNSEDPAYSSYWAVKRMGVVEEIELQDKPMRRVSRTSRVVRTWLVVIEPLDVLVLVRPPSAQTQGVEVHSRG